MNIIKKPLPRTSRLDPYIKDGEFAYIYANGKFRKVKSDFDSGGGAFQFNYCDNGEVGAMGQSYEYLLSTEDLKWFKSVISRYGEEYYFELKPMASNDEDVAYLLCWLESADLNIQLRAQQYRESGKTVTEYCLDPQKFLNAIRAVKL